MHIRDLHTLEDYAAVVDLQRRVWGEECDDIVPLSMLAVAGKIGGILLGAVAEDGRLVGFVFSLPGIREGRPMQWSHMLGVLPEHRGSGVGWRLKCAQRERTLGMALDLIEWTFDPLMAPNAHLNVARLGAVVETYLEDVYGASASPLHRGAPTDRFVATWRIASPHVRRRLEASALVARDASVREAPMIIETVERSRFRAPAGEPRLDVAAPRVFVETPVAFLEMLADEPDLALEWRLVTRRVFQHLFSRGYRVVDFTWDRRSARAGYLLQHR
ncbi:MAG TPA: hypothetical protein VIL35_06680 [Vicinamibacterales bacterium]